MGTARFLMMSGHVLKKVGYINKNLIQYGGDNDFTLTANRLYDIKTYILRDAICKLEDSVTGIKNQNINKKNVAYYLIPVTFEIDGNFIGYIKFKRALSLSNKMLNFDKESIQVVKGDSTGAIKVRGTLTIVGLPDEFF